MNDDNDFKVRFGLITDLHYAEADACIGREYRNSLRKLSEFVAKMNERKVDFVVELGDFKDKSPSADPKIREAETLGFLGKLEAEFSKFNGARYHALGNHDMDAISKEQFLARVKNTGFDKALPNYAFSAGGIRFIVLDPNFNADLSPYDHGNFDWTVAVIPQEQIMWLKDELANSKEPVIILVHQRLDTCDALAVQESAKIRSILEESKRVIAVIQGHHHPGDMKEINSIPYYTVYGAISDYKPNDSYFIEVAVGKDNKVIVTPYSTCITKSALQEKAPLP